MRTQELTPQQMTFVDETLTSVNNKMFELASKGDANASAAVDQLRKRTR